MYGFETCLLKKTESARVPEIYPAILPEMYLEHTRFLPMICFKSVHSGYPETYLIPTQDQLQSGTFRVYPKYTLNIPYSYPRQIEIGYVSGIPEMYPKHT